MMALLLHLQTVYRPFEEGGKMTMMLVFNVT